MSAIKREAKLLETVKKLLREVDLELIESGHSDRGGDHQRGRLPIPSPRSWCGSAGSARRLRRFWLPNCSTDVLTIGGRPRRYVSASFFHAALFALQGSMRAIIARTARICLPSRVK